MKILKNVIHAWNLFWFESDGYAQMHLFRRGLAFLLFFSYLIRSLDLELYYSDLGLVQLSVLPEIIDTRYRYSLLSVFNGVKALWVMNGVFLLCLLLLGLGVLTRLSSILAIILHVSFLHRNPGSVYGADTVTTYFLFFLCMFNFRNKRANDLEKRSFVSALSSVAFRLSQIQLCIIYAFAGLHKLKGIHWWNGEAVWAVLANAQMARWDFSWIAHYPLLFILPTYATLIFEIYFPVLIWVPAVRKPLLIYGLLLHMGIGLAMNIPIFATLMVLSYVLFLDRPTAQKWSAWLDRILILPSRGDACFDTSPSTQIQKERSFYGEAGPHWNRSS